MAQAPQAQEHEDRAKFRALMMNYVTFAAVGLTCSLLLNSYYGITGNDISYHPPSQFSLKEVGEILQGMDCEEFEKEAKLPDDIKFYMSTKLRYQFDSTAKDSCFIDRCKATKVYGLMRHGTRYPTLKYLNLWEVLHSNLSERLGPSGPTLSSVVEPLRKWTNPLNQDMANPSDLAEHGMKEHYCLASRLRKRFPDIVRRVYSSLTTIFRSTEKSRAKQSALSFAQGLFQDTNPESISMKVVKEEDDVVLRFSELPCPVYDKTVNKVWFDTFLETPAFKAVVQNIQQHFNPEYWKLKAEDIVTFYKICIHETSLLGKSQWCDLFSTEDLSVLEFYADLKAFWIKGSGYPITGKRSVHLMQEIIHFLAKGKQPLSLSFAHAETVLPFLALLETFPVPTPLTPENYPELKSRKYMTSKMAPYSANVHLVLYECPKEEDSAGFVQYVRLLVNEEPQEIGLCKDTQQAIEEDQLARDHSLCKLDVLKERAYKATHGFSPLTELCQEPL